jgi:hypothetical protein
MSADDVVSRGLREIGEGLVVGTKNIIVYDVTIG